MKKVLAYSLSLALLLISLTACNKPQDTQQSGPTQSATSIPEATQTATPEPPAQNTSEPLSSKAPATNENEVSQSPEDIENQEPDGAVEPTFRDCNETVYATGTVNLRSGPSTEDEKVGSLNKGDAVNRIGIGEGDYEGWSLILTKDWKLVYVASSYLSATKPTNDTPTSKPQETTKPAPKPAPTAPAPTDTNDAYGGLISQGDDGDYMSQEELKEGIDPNRDPWDTQYKPIYGGG